MGLLNVVNTRYLFRLAAMAMDAVLSGRLKNEIVKSNIMFFGCYCGVC